MTRQADTTTPPSRRVSWTSAGSAPRYHADHEEGQVPEISRYYGMVLAMFFKDHDPPHFHVRYGASRAIVALDTLDVLRGDLPPRALSLVRELARLHAGELREDWRRARASEPLLRIDPLQ